MRPPKPGFGNSKPKLAVLLGLNKRLDRSYGPSKLTKLAQRITLIQTFVFVCLLTTACDSSSQTNIIGSNRDISTSSTANTNSIVPTPDAIKSNLLPSSAISPVRDNSTPIIANGSLAYDNEQQLVLLFGGASGTSQGNLNDTWAWNGKNWSELRLMNAPSPRNGASITSSLDQVVLFGGTDNQGKALGDTWVWNGKNWIQQHPITSPSARTGASMVYDPIHKVVLLFGGDAITGRTPQLLNDLWSWDGQNWNQQKPSSNISPSPRTGASIIYDKLSQTSLLFGGADVTQLNDTWGWDGISWVQFHPTTSPAARTNASSAYNEAKQQLILFGGEGSSDDFNDTWSWDGKSWTQLLPTTSPTTIRNRNSLIYDKARQNVVLFVSTKGKQSATTETWIWEGANWIKMAG